MGAFSSELIDIKHFFMHLYNKFLLILFIHNLIMWTLVDICLKI